MKKKNITIDTLTKMIAKGFEETAKKKDVDKRFDKVESRLERIEKLLIVDHRRRIEKLEIAAKELRELLAVR
ncbi:MAG TPA: hypothetical protein ENI19_03920 [Candidatus Nealsonbacteria bacterium]|uniref:Uncharacterized protein n=1 Tax=marine sediment metagenome TaxID=412755 RepID=A0A0F9UJZ5_9ZZZZ|nr:hypothetical protein [Candidatus Nealsonbacteria bacterium]HEB46816.1 hypothetical protein [Candidatus Nealsonbacteria bacterium]